MRASTELSGTWSRMSCPKKAAAAEIAPGGVVGDLVVTFPDKKFGYSGVTNDRDSLDRCAMDHTLPDRMRAAIVKGRPTERNPDLTMLFGRIDINGNGHIDMHEFVNFLMKYDTLHPTIADCEKIFFQVAQGAHDLSPERWLDWLSGRKTAAAKLAQHLDKCQLTGGRTAGRSSK